MRPSFDIYNFLIRSLPYHKRQANRVNLFFWPMDQLNYLWTLFSSWRQEIAWEMRTTGQTLSLTAWLNHVIPNSGNAISIVEATDGGIPIGLLSEALVSIDLGLSTEVGEATANVEFPKYGELLTPLSKDFQVLIPATANAEQVNAIVARYVIAGFDYEIIQAS